MHARTWLTLVVALLLVGCASTTPRHVDSPGESWSEAASESWIHRSSGCGFCSGDPDDPEHALLAYYPTGEVLRVRYGAGQEDGASGIQFTPKTASMEAVVRALFEKLAITAEDRVLRVHETTAYRIEEGAARQVTHVFESGLRHVQDPGEPDLSDTADYGGTRIVVDGRDGARDWDVHLNAFHHEHDAWGTLLDQTAQLDQWLSRQPGG